MRGGEEEKEVRKKRERKRERDRCLLPLSRRSKYSAASSNAAMFKFILFFSSLLFTAYGLVCVSVFLDLIQFVIG